MMGRRLTPCQAGSFIGMMEYPVDGTIIEDLMQNLRPISIPLAYKILKVLSSTTGAS
jgi:hypothetical protein